MARDKDVESKRGRSSKRSRHRSSSPSSSSSYSSSSSQSPDPYSRKSSRRKSTSSSRHGESRKNSKRSKSRSSRGKGHRDKNSKRRSRKSRHDDSSDSTEYSSRDDEFGVKEKVPEPREMVMSILEEFPNLASQLHQILQMIDNGQGVELSGISDRTLEKLIKKLFISLKLEKNRKGVYMLSPKSLPSLDIVGPTLTQFMKPSQTNAEETRNEPEPSNKDEKEKEPPSPPKRRVIGPAMPSRELLEAAAELTHANDLLREAEIEEDGVLIGPPPPALVAEAESANEAERFEEVTRIMGADANSPYDVLGINWKMAPENMKKKYWKLSLFVHPDKCSHPHAQEAFVILNKAYKDLQDPNKRGAIDDKLKAKEEQEKFEIDLRSLREAAQWRKLQGITMEGDEELLAVFAPKEDPKRDEWMTELPPEKKTGMATTMQSTTSFSRTAKEGRGDTSAWTDTPLDKANKAKQHYLEAYDRAKAIADAEEDEKAKRKPTLDSLLVDEYTSSKKSLVEKHKEEKKKREKKREKKERENGKEGEWAGNHPWKPWDREKDLTAGRQSVNLDPKNMSKDLTSRFSAGPTQRNFL